jgi:hypothetical protein
MMLILLNAAIIVIKEFLKAPGTHIYGFPKNAGKFGKKNQQKSFNTSSSQKPFYINISGFLNFS